jgi:hypothetical protein
VERITNTEKITINAFEEPFSKQIEDKMLELKQLKYRANEYDAVIVGNFDNFQGMAQIKCRFVKEAVTQAGP